MTLSVVVPQTIQEYARCLDIHHRSQDICLHATVYGGKHKGRHEETIRQLVESACDVPHDHERRWILADCLEDADDGQAGLGDVAQIQRMIGDKLSEFRLMQEACRNSNRYLEFLKLQQDKYGLFLFLGDRPHRISQTIMRCMRCGLSVREIALLPREEANPTGSTRRQCGSGPTDDMRVPFAPRCCVRSLPKSPEWISIPDKIYDPLPVLEHSPQDAGYHEKRFMRVVYSHAGTETSCFVYRRADSGRYISMDPDGVRRFLFYVSEFLDWNVSDR